MALDKYVSLATIKLTESTSSVDFLSIPQIYSDLVLVINSSRSTSSNIDMRFNSDSGSNYSFAYMLGEGSTPTSASGTLSTMNFGYTSTAPTLQILEIMEYSKTNKHKNTFLRHNRADLQVNGGIFRWASTAGVTSISLVTSGGTFSANSTFDLYGVR